MITKKLSENRYLVWSKTCHQEWTTESRAKDDHVYIEKTEEGKSEIGATEIAQWLIVWPTRPEDLSLILSIHAGQLPTTCNSSPRENPTPLACFNITGLCHLCHIYMIRNKIIKYLKRTQRSYSSSITSVTKLVCLIGHIWNVDMQQPLHTVAVVTVQVNWCERVWGSCQRCAQQTFTT